MTRRAKQQPKMEQPLLDRLPKDAVFAHATAAHGEKFSDVIQRFAAPLLEEIEEDTYEAYYISIMLAVIAWNLATFPPHLRPKEVVRLLAATPEELRDVFREEISWLVERKDKEFAEHQWLVMDFSLIEEADEYRLMVAVQLPSADEEAA